MKRTGILMAMAILWILPVMMEARSQLPLPPFTPAVISSGQVGRAEVLLRNSCRTREGRWKKYLLMFGRMKMNQNLTPGNEIHFIPDNKVALRKRLYPRIDEPGVEQK